MARRFPSLLPAFALLFLLSVAPAAAQFPWVGARATGMGGAEVASVADNSAAWANPAALASLKGWSVQVLGGGTAQNRNDLVGSLVGLSSLPWNDIVNGDRPDLIPAAIAGIARLAKPGSSVIASGVFGAVVSYQGFALSIGDVPYAGIYPIIDLTHVVPGGGPGNGIAFNQTGLYLAGLSGREARLAYGHAFFSGILEVGGAVRYVSGVTYFGRCGVADETCRGVDLSDLIHDAFQQNAVTTNKFTFDAGARANFGIAKVGVVATAINQPDFSVAPVPGSPGTVPLPRQVRAGASVDALPFLSVAADGDLIKSDTLVPGVQSQQMSIGVEGRIPLFAFRAGATYDFASPNPTWCYTAGLGVGIPLLSVDVAVLWGPTGGFNYKNADREMLGGSASVKLHF
ncbi:MAG TPA: conjugal transfer protein TraF [Thermoanaerobaculia bacterium]|nr:conjugal transfer protein TraF [Thermoanaerobaculia bacterium]